jgi:threonine dehydrogenase-like Zn-dependent dehydrogenase
MVFDGGLILALRRRCAIAQRNRWKHTSMSDQHFNFVIVGSGAGGLAAVITAKLAGLHPLVLEKGRA